MRVWRDCLEGMGMLSGVYGEAVWMVWGGCRGDMGKLVTCMTNVFWIC